MRLTGTLAIALLAVAANLSAQETDEHWKRDCERYNGDRDMERVCEVRTTGFRLTGRTLSIDPDPNGGAEIVGWDRDSVAVSFRIQASARSEDDARELARRVQVDASGSSIAVRSSSGGHHGSSVSTTIVVRVPRKIGLRAATTNGPLSVDGVEGDIDVQSQNGPLSLARLAGDVHARVQNGPLDVVLSGSGWTGAGLDAEAVNGPVSLAIPDPYNANLETGTVNGPMDTRIPLTVTFKGSLRDRIRTTLGKGGAPVRVVTTNGPITIDRAR